MRRLSSLAFGCIALVTLAVAGTASAQSAADKATARQLATQGIELHGQGKYAEALDRLQRAQALYDAPVHLLYIARSQAKLGQFVESSETYRRLIRVQLEPGAPPAFRDAVESAKKEVGDVEAKIGQLRIDVAPPNLAGLEVTIDGQKVSSAVIGVERPANPGKHVVAVSAPGYNRAEESVDIAEAEKETILLELVVDPKAKEAPPPGVAGTPGATSTAGGGATAATPGPEAPADAKGVNVLLGLRIGGVIPSGSLYNVGGEETAFGDFVTAGAGIEISAGAWFAKYFGAKLHIEGFGYGPGEQVDDIDNLEFGATVTNQATGHGVGISLLGGTPLDRYGVFGELGFTFVHALRVSREFTAIPTDDIPCETNFEQTLTFNGAALRLGAGARLPVAKVLHLTPFVLASFGQFGSLKNENTCPDVLDESLGRGMGDEASLPPDGDFADDVKSSHQLFFIGLGGEFVLPLR